MDTIMDNAQSVNPSGESDGEGRRAPLLSIGLPVYNGDLHLREAIDSLLAQDIDDFELIISDNASTDSTPEICASYAASDPRVRYFRNQENIGGSANYNRVFELSRGEYFMWGSDDDVWDPRFARLCLARLQLSPTAVLCASEVTFIGADGGPRPDFVYEAIDTPGMSVEARVHELVRRWGWYGTYAVIRPEALKATRLFRPIFGPDVVLACELLLLGENLVVPETLFTYRLRDDFGTPREQLASMNPDAAQDGKIDELSRPWTGLARQLLETVRMSPVGERTIRDIEDDFVDTLSMENVFLGEAILHESGLYSELPTSREATKAALRTALKIHRATHIESSDEELQYAWRPKEEIRLQAIRNALLRLLQPFADRQREIDLGLDDSLARLRHEVAWLRRRVEDLERRQ